MNFFEKIGWMAWIVTINGISSFTDTTSSFEIGICLVLFVLSPILIFNLLEEGKKAQNSNNASGVSK